MKITKELLIKLRDQAILSHKERFFGLCCVIEELKYLDLISNQEYFELNNWLKLNLPKYTFGLYCWEKKDIESRVKWLNKHIDKL
jgi:hypothetical protein